MKHHHARTTTLMLVIIIALVLTSMLLLSSHGNTGGANPAVAAQQSLGDAVASLDDLPGSLAIDRPRTVLADVRIPRNVHLRFVDSGCLDVPRGVTVTIDGPIDAPLRHVFKGEGIVTFGSTNTAIAELYPQWWGARGDDEYDDTRAVQAAIDAARDMGGGEVVIIKGTFKTTDTLYVWGVEKDDTQPTEVLATRSIQVRGVSRRSSVIHYTGDSICMWLCTNPRVGGRTYHHSAAVVRSLHLKGSARSGIGLQVAAPAHNTGSWGGTAIIENNCIEFFDIGLYVEHSYGSRFSHNKIRYNNTGVQLGSAEGTYGTVNGNYFRDSEISHNRQKGLRIYYARGCIFEGGLIERNGEEAVYIERKGKNDTDHVTFREIWFEANQNGQPAANLGQVYLHSTRGFGYESLFVITFERCTFSGQGKNYQMRLGNTLGLQLIYNKFGHPNDRIIYRMPDTYQAWALIRAHDETQIKVIKGVLAGGSDIPGDKERDDIQGSESMPHVYFPANASRHQRTASIEADARTHSSIASAAGVFTTQHLFQAGKEDATPVIVLPKGAALIGLSAYGSQALDADATIALRINGKPTNLAMVMVKGSTASYQAFHLSDYRELTDWASHETNEISLTCTPPNSISADLHIVAFWRSNHLPVF